VGIDVLQAISTEVLALAIDNPTSACESRPVEEIAEIATLEAANCEPFTSDLTRSALACNETVGCHWVDSDYSFWFGEDRSDPDPWYWSTSLLDNSTADFYDGSTEYHAAKLQMYAR